MMLKDRVAVVTGGNSGIGQAIVIALARAGAHVVISARRQKRNQEMAQNLTQQFGTRTLPVQADVSREEDCERLIRETIATFGTLHLFVNNAGIAGGGPIASTPTNE